MNTKKTPGRYRGPVSGDALLPWEEDRQQGSHRRIRLVQLTFANSSALFCSKVLFEGSGFRSPRSTM